MTRSSDWRFRSTIHSTFPSRRASGSASASQMFPSSSSASPSSEMKRPFVDEPKWLSTYLSASAAKSGAAEPSPTEPVEKSTGYGSFVRDG